MIGLILGDTQLGKVIIKKLKLLNIEFIIIDISKKKIFKRNKNSHSLSIGQLGKAISILKKNRCKKIIFAGRVNKPNFSKVKFDLKALYYLPKIIKESKKGDAPILKVIIKIFKKEGFKIIKSTFFNPELVLTKGIRGNFRLTASLNLAGIHREQQTRTPVQEPLPNSLLYSLDHLTSKSSKLVTG